MAIWFITRDWCGLACFLFGVVTTWFTNYVVVTRVILPWMGWTTRAFVHILALQAIVLLAFYSHVRCACTNPGTLLKNTVRMSRPLRRLAGPLSPLARRAEPRWSKKSSTPTAPMRSGTGEGLFPSESAGELVPDPARLRGSLPLLTAATPQALQEF